MTAIIKHRVNTVTELESTPKDCGIEIDIRPYSNSLILHHDPFCAGVELNSFLDHYNHGLIMANIKAEGIEESVIKEFEKRNIENYFLFDISFGLAIKLSKQGFKKFALRFSEYESLANVKLFPGYCEWVFVDSFTHIPAEKCAFRKIRETGAKIALVSPELHNRTTDLNIAKDLLLKNQIQAILTDDITLW
mgnify:CR=1 FL=1|jgi:hypothetical protein